MRLMIYSLAAILCLTASSFAQGSGGDSVPNAAAPVDATTAAPADSVPAPADTTTAAPAPQYYPTPPEPANPPSTGPQIVIVTSMGDIKVQLDSVRAPATTANILKYVHYKHYDGTVVYRVVKGALIEMGSWDARVIGRPAFPGKLPLEVRNGLSNVRGSVALARGEEPDSGGADFFINVGDESPLDAAKDVPGKTTGYAVFGQVISGMNVVDAINKVAVGDKGPMPGEAPVTPIQVKSVTVVPGTDNSPAPAAKPSAKKKK